MPSNVQADPGVGGEILVSKRISHDGDNAHAPGTWLIAITGGTEDAYTYEIVGGSAANGLDVDVTRVSGNVTVINAGTFAVQAAQAGAWNIGTVATVTTCSTVTNLAQLGGQAISMGTGIRDVGTQRVTIATDDLVSVNQQNTASIDYDTGAGTVNQKMMGVALPGAGGPVAGGTSSDPLRIDPTGTTSQPTTVAELPDAAALNEGMANPTTTQIGAFLMVKNGATWDRVVMGADDGSVLVNLGTGNTIQGVTGHGTSLVGSPLRVGVRAVTADYTPVTNNQVADLISTGLGKQVVYPYAVPAKSWSYATATGGVTDTADDVAKSAVASTRNYITGVQVINGHATADTEVVIKDGTTVLWRGWAQNSGGGCSAEFTPPLRGSVNTAINVANITNGSKTYFNLQGFESAE